jgi:hypothetical protein
MIFASSALHQGGVRANFTIAFRSDSPSGTNDTTTFNTLPTGGDSFSDLIYFGGIGLILNITIIIGLIIYDRRRGTK